MKKLIKKIPVFLLIFSSFTITLFLSKYHLLTTSDTLTVPKAPNLCTGSLEDIVNKRKVIAYSFYGEWSKKPSFARKIDGLAKQASLNYKDWMIRVYHDSMIRNETIEYVLKNNDNVMFCNIEKLNITIANTAANVVNGRLYRYIPIGDITVSILCSRDIDSPLTYREADAVNQWIDSGKYLNVMRDNKWHRDWPIFAGMFCVRNDLNRTRSDYIFRKLYQTSLPRGSSKYSDQDFLKIYVWPLIKNDTMQHDAYHCQNPEYQAFGGITPFRIVAGDSEYVGCRYPCNEKREKCPVQCRIKGKDGC